MDLSGTTWEVVSLDDGNGSLGPVLQGTKLTLAYDGQRISGKSGCNSYFGPASLDDKVQIGPLASTMMFCAEPEGVMEQERRFLEQLGAVDSADIQDQRIELKHEAKTTIVMVPVPVELTGSWSLVMMYNDRAALISPMLDTEITAVFEEGRLHGHSGCNRYTTTYQVGDSTLHIAPPAGTRMMCSEPEGVMEQEARFLGLLSNTAGFAIREEGILDLYDDEGLRLLQFARAPTRS